MSTQRASQLLEAGLWLRLSGDHEGARRLFEQAVRLDPSNDKARQLLEAAVARAAELQEANQEVPVVPEVARASPPDLIESDWALATGFIEERRKMIPPAPLPATLVPVAAAPRPAVRAELPDFAVDPELEWELPAVGVKAPPEADAGPSRGLGLERLEPPLPRTISGWDAQSGPGEQLGTAEAGEAMDLVVEDALSPTEPPAPNEEGDTRQEVEALLAGARELLELDDHSGAMELILKSHALAPTHPEVQALRERSERTLLAMFESKLGGLERTPRVQLKDDEIIWLNLDHRAGFVLAQIDGSVTFDDVFAVSGMSRLDTARILSQLLEEGVIV